MTSIVSSPCKMTQFKANKIPQFVPQGYHLDLYPDVDSKLVKGTVTINIATYAEPTNIIELDADPAVYVHYKSIKVKEQLQNGKPASNKTSYSVSAIERVLYDTGKLRIYVTEKLQRDLTYQLHMNFESPLRNVSCDEPFYLKTYTDSNSTEKIFAVMDLTKTGCFKAFPCFNDRAYKSWIVLTVTRKSSFYAFTAVSVNYSVPLNNEGSLVKDYFHRTPPISMNSLALVVSDFKMEKPDRSREEYNQTEVPKDTVPAFVFDVDIVKHVIKQLEEYLSLQFPVSTFNVMTYPNSAEIPSIDAYGLLVTRSPDTEAEYLQHLIKGILSQWFSHSATPVSSTDSIVQAIIHHLSRKMSTEIVEKMHFEIKNPFTYDQIDFVNSIPNFDIVLVRNRPTFNGLGVNVLDKVYGSKLLTDALQLLYRKKEFKMFTDNELWQAINEIAFHQLKHEGRTPFNNLQAVVDSWNNPDFLPLVTVRRDYTSNLVNITQEPLIYGLDEFKLYEARENASYYHPRIIPMVFSQPSNVFSGNEELLGWMTTESETYELKSLYPVDYIVINPSRLAFTVTNYDDRNWHLLVENFHSLPMSIKLQLLFDSMILANMNKIDYSIFLRMSSEIISNEEYLPLWMMYSKLVREQMYRFHGLVGRKYKEFVLTQTSTFFENIPKDKFDNYPTTTKRAIENEKKQIKYELSCSRSRTSCFTLWEYELFMYEVRMGKPLTGKHKCEIVKNISLMDWEIVANSLFHALQNNLTDQKSVVLRVLACTENPLAFETFMNLMFLNFNGHGLSISEEEQIYVLGQFKPLQHHMLLNFVNKNFQKLNDRLSKPVWKQLMKSVIVTTRTDSDLKDLFAFFNKHSGHFDEAEELIREGLVIISKRVNWELEIYPIVENWLDNVMEGYKKF